MGIGFELKIQAYILIEIEAVMIDFIAAFLCLII